MHTTLAHRVRSTGLAFAALAATGALVIGLATARSASPSATAAPPDDHVDHAAMGSPLADEAPAPPAAGEVVGVLDLFGRPLLGPDGQPLRVPLRPPSPEVPANADDVYLPTDGAEPTAGVEEVDLLGAHAVTLNEVANDEGYDLVQRFDLLRANGMITSGVGVPASVDLYRGILAALDGQVRVGDPASACTTADLAAAQADGIASDLVVGQGAAQIRDEVVAVRDRLDCA